VERGASYAACAAHNICLYLYAYAYVQTDPRKRSTTTCIFDFILFYTQTLIYMLYESCTATATAILYSGWSMRTTHEQQQATRKEAGERNGEPEHKHAGR